MSLDPDPLRLFHPVVRLWFARRVGEPTEIQRRVWPRIAAGEHVLAHAPTGSGKTLAAFLWALDRLLTGACPGGAVRVLYVSPLRALGNDVRRNLLGPLRELADRFEAAGEPARPVRVATRTGDTPPDERRRMERLPPEILITTPETLGILLTSRGGRRMLGGVTSLILDEVHAVAGTKRGALLSVAVERLARVAGEFQRVGLSATVRPEERVALWLGGASPEAPRPVAVVRSGERKRYAISVRYPRASVPPVASGSEAADAWGSALREELDRRLAENRATLIFANSRRTVERVACLLNEGEAEPRVWAHHGSLSREIRTVVEERLKTGRLRGIVATTSLELGIDIGSLDEVVLLGTPPTAASAAQRIGRAGHAVGGVSRACFLPLNPRDLLQAAVAARAVTEGEIEALSPPASPLDVLAQAIVSMTATETWSVEDVHATLAASDPFRGLSRQLLDRVLEMLSGRYASTRIRELRPLVSVDRVEGTVRGRSGAERLVYLSGGAIADRGYFHLRREGTGALLGELDEEFVWERRVGDAFSLGVQAWRIARITHNDVFVSPAGRGVAIAPFWRADERNRGFALSERVGLFLAEAEKSLDDPTWISRLASEHGLDLPAAAALARFLTEERSALGGILPHRRRIVAERLLEGRGGNSRQVVLHTFWGGRVNRAFALALEAAWAARHGDPVEVVHDDDSIGVSSAAAVDPGEMLSLVDAANLDRLVAAGLGGTGFFGARFREAAGIALLLPREGFRRRTPLWISRRRAKELLDATSRWDDFPITLEAWRACLADELEIEALRGLLGEVREGKIELAVTATVSPSPFAAGVVWKRTNERMYDDDAPLAGRSRTPRRDLLRDLVFDAALRPRVPASLVPDLERKLRRTWPGYAPATAEELLDLLLDRTLVPAGQWSDLLEALDRDRGPAAAGILQGACGKTARVRLPGADEPAFVAAVEALPRILRALEVTAGAVELLSPIPGGPADPEAEAALRRLAGGPEPAPPDEEAADPLAEIAADLLRFHGPVDPAIVAEVLDLPAERLAQALESLADAGRVVAGALLEGSEALRVCDAANLETLLRRKRAQSRSRLQPLPIDRLPLFLAAWHGLGGEARGAEGLRGALERLFGFPAPAETWEAEILPARLAEYSSAWLDSLLAETGLRWFGCGDRRISFALEEELGLFLEPSDDDPERTLDALLPPEPGRSSFEGLLTSSRLPSAEIGRRLWELVWAGRVSNDGFAAVRRGLATSFEPAEGPPSSRRPGTGRPLRFDRWRTTRPFGGTWYRLPRPSAETEDALDLDERNRERVRILLDRYGVLFRELADRELPPLQWGRLFRTLRLMELSGEAVAGEFFAGVPGLQFASPAAAKLLADGLPEDRAWWVNATDPASPCGLGIEALPDGLPRRVPGSHAAFHGPRLVVASEGRGRTLRVLASPGDPRLTESLSFLRALAERDAGPRRRLVVETINGEPAAASPYRAGLAAMFEAIPEGGALALSRWR